MITFIPSHPALRPLPAASGPSPALKPAAGPSPSLPADRLEPLAAAAGSLPRVPLAFNETFVKNSGGKFTIDGQPFRYVGANMYDLAHEKPATTEKMFADAARVGFTVLRFWAHPDVSPAKLQTLCDLASRHNLKLIPVLANHWRLNAQDKQNDHWYKEGYKKHYLPYVETLVKAGQDRPEIMMWELINEPETEHFESIYHFAGDASARIRSLDANHLISIGTIGGVGDRFGSQLSRLSIDNFRRLYALPHLNAVSIHDYSYDARPFERLDIYFRTQKEPEKSAFFGKVNHVFSFLPKKLDALSLDLFDARRYSPFSLRSLWRHMNHKDLDVARELGKPLYVGEVGFKKFHGDDRRELVDLDIASYFKRGAQGYMLWSFEAQGRSIDGHDYGFTSQDGFGPVIRKWNRP